MMDPERKKLNDVLRRINIVLVSNLDQLWANLVEQITSMSSSELIDLAQLTMEDADMERLTADKLNMIRKFALVGLIEAVKQYSTKLSDNIQEQN